MPTGGSVMTVDTISKNKIRIDLTNEEIEIFFGGYEHINYSDPDSKLAINLILKEALPNEMFPLDCKRVILEVSPTHSGCSILFTKIYTDRKKRYRVTGHSKSYLLAFTDSESLITGCKELSETITKPIKSELYFEKTDYYLLIHSTMNITGQLPHISEYGAFICAQPEIIAKVREYTALICKDNAIEKISKAF